MIGGSDDFEGGGGSHPPRTGSIGNLPEISIQRFLVCGFLVCGLTVPVSVSGSSGWAKRESGSEGRQRKKACGGSGSLRHETYRELRIDSRKKKTAFVFMIYVFLCFNVASTYCSHNMASGTYFEAPIRSGSK